MLTNLALGGLRRMGPANWSEGDRFVRCLIWFESKTAKKSAKGSKGRGLPGFSAGRRIRPSTRSAALDGTV